LFVLLFFYAVKKKKKRVMKFGNYKTLEKVAGGKLVKSSNVLLLLHLLAVAAFLIGISSPTIVDKVPSAEADYVVAIDSSASMFTNDIEPSRFEAAKSLTKNFISKLGNDSRVGIVSYAGEVNKVTDGIIPSGQAIQAVDDIQMGTTAGTAIGDAISSSTTMLLGSNKSKRVILITDGKNNAGISLNESITFAKNHNTTVFTLGIGSEKNMTRRYEIINGENTSRAVFPNIDRKVLERVARETGGNATFATNSSAVQTAFVQMTQTRKETDLTPYFIMAGIVFLLLDWIFKTTPYASLP
jgi:Ca-activated chloride channel family protein